MCMTVPMSVCVPHVCCCPQRLDEGFGFPRTDVRNDYEIPSPCWGLNVGFMQEQCSCSLIFPGLEMKFKSIGWIIMLFLKQFSWLLISSCIVHKSAF